jgi:protoporphyrinogen oxidase
MNSPLDNGNPAPVDANLSSPVIIGAGPAGLTAAYQFAKANVRCVVLESDSVVGGISRTVETNGWRFDIGGHRFFTKVKAVDDLWHEILPADEFLMRPRMSRIFYNGKLFDYPLKAFDALRKLGALEAVRCVGSYAWVRIRPPKDLTTFEGWTASKFGWRLYRMFFKTYTEKVWGVPATDIKADWAAQRIKNLNLFNAVTTALLPKRNQKNITSLIEEFQYPKFGPGLMWDRCREKVEAFGSTVAINQRVTKITHSKGIATTVISTQRNGVETVSPCSSIISSMPLPQLLLAMDPPAPSEVTAAAREIKFRDFLTVALVVPLSRSFPDNWIYIHEPDVKVGRVQNFASWSPFMVKAGRTCLGLEYFVTEGDEMWAKPDEDLIALGTSEMIKLGLLGEGDVQEGYVFRMPKAYPMYDATYKANVDTIRSWLGANAANVFPVGRNGMHRYNNQDHSMYTAMLTVENIVSGTTHDVWSVNVEEDYHETSVTS